MSCDEDNLDFEIAFLESLYKRDDSDPRVIEVLATLYTSVGLVNEGLALDERHVQLEPKNPSAHYNLGCSLALHGRPDEAFASLRLALLLGFDDVEWMLKDPDLKPLHKDPRFHSLIKEMQVES